jgi:hypothetical protein
VRVRPQFEDALAAARETVEDIQPDLLIPTGRLK